MILMDTVIITALQRQSLRYYAESSISIIFVFAIMSAKSPAESALVLQDAYPQTRMGGLIRRYLALYPSLQ